MKPLRIAFVSPFRPQKGGIAQFSQLLQGTLEQAGHQVTVIPYRKLYPRWLTGASSSTEPFNGSGTASSSFRLDLFNPFSWFSTALQIRREHPDVVLVAYWIGIQAPLCYVLRRFSGVKSVVLLHNFTSHERIPFVESLWKMILGASADGFITLSGSVRRELMQFSPSARAVELFHPVYDPFGLLPSKEEARLQLGLGSKEQVLLFFGYVRHYKGLDMLLEALALAGAQGSPIRLIVAGEFFQNVETYRELARALGVAGHVSLEPGYVPPERVATLFCAADAVVLPYRAASQSGVVQLAFGHNTPVIVNDTGGLAGQVDHRRTGWVVADPSPRTLAEAIVAFFRERESLQMEEHIREVRNSRSWSRFGAGAGKFLNEVKNEGHVG